MNLAGAFGWRVPEAARRNLGTLHQRLELAPGDVRIDGMKRRKTGKTAVRASDHPFPADEIGVLLDALRDHFGMFNIVRTSVDHTGHDDLVTGKLHLFEEAPFMRITWILPLRAEAPSAAL